MYRSASSPPTWVSALLEPLPCPSCMVVKRTARVAFRCSACVCLCRRSTHSFVAPSSTPSNLLLNQLTRARCASRPPSPCACMCIPLPPRPLPAVASLLPMLFERCAHVLTFACRVCARRSHAGSERLPCVTCSVKRRSCRLRPRCPISTVDSCCLRQPQHVRGCSIASRLLSLFRLARVVVPAALAASALVHVVRALRTPASLVLAQAAVPSCLLSLFRLALWSRPRLSCQRSRACRADASYASFPIEVRVEGSSSSVSHIISPHY